MSGILLFDGECRVCNRSVQFILKHDKHAYFQFAALHGTKGTTLLETYMPNIAIDSVVLIENGRAYVKSDAIIHICHHLDGIWRLGTLLKIIPKPLRDFGYDQFAKRRYKWFGKQTQCLLPSPEVRKRFLDE